MFSNCAETISVIYFQTIYQYLGKKWRAKLGYFVWLCMCPNLLCYMRTRMHPATWETYAVSMY
jgi:hypothetical protein